MNKTTMQLMAKFKPETNVLGTEPIVLNNINRTIMAQTLGEFGFTHGVEVGVAEGLHAKVLLDNIPNLALHLVDIWQTYPGYDEYQNIDEVFDQALERLKNYKVHYHREYSAQAISEFSDNSLDFVYIDAGHDFLNVSMDVALWTKKVKPGGIVFGHDYKFRALPNGKRHAVHVKPVVDAYVQCMDIKPLFILNNDIKDETFGHDNKGWLFVKEER